MSRPFSALVFSSVSVGLACACRPVSFRRAVRLVLAARARGGPLRLSPGSVVVGNFLCLSFPWALRWERFESRLLDFWLGRVVLPVADRLFPVWAARRWPD